MTHYKQPVSVLVVIYTLNALVEAILRGTGKQKTAPSVLLLERADHPGYWQSVTGSCERGETLVDTAMREVNEETGLDASQYQLTDWQSQNVYEIYPQWRFRYSPGTTHNSEHVFSLELPYAVPIQLAPREHLSFQWLAWQDAAEAVFSPSNRAAIIKLAEDICPHMEMD